jgi:hypothetical protein
MAASVFAPKSDGAPPLTSRKLSLDRSGSLPSPDSTLVVRCLSAWRHLLCCSPDLSRAARGAAAAGGCHRPKALIATLAHALLREDAGFRAYQTLEAGVRQYREWGNGVAGRHILIAVARYLAAHSPTERAALQTADIARRLMRGGELHQGTPTAR